VGTDRQSPGRILGCPGRKALCIAHERVQDRTHTGPVLLRRVTGGDWPCAARSTRPLPAAVDQSAALRGSSACHLVRRRRYGRTPTPSRVDRIGPLAECRSTHSFRRADGTAVVRDAQLGVHVVRSKRPVAARYGPSRSHARLSESEARLHDGEGCNDTLCRLWPAGPGALPKPLPNTSACECHKNLLALASTDVPILHCRRQPILIEGSIAVHHRDDWSVPVPAAHVRNQIWR
jgi:hypothetical protein